MEFWIFPEVKPYFAQLKKGRPCKASLFSSETPKKYKLKFRFHGKKIGRQYFAQISEQEYLVWIAAEIRSVEIL